MTSLREDEINVVYKITRIKSRPFPKTKCDEKKKKILFPFTNATKHGHAIHPKRNEIFRKTRGEDLLRIRDIYLKREPKTILWCIILHNNLKCYHFQ